MQKRIRAVLSALALVVATTPALADNRSAVTVQFKLVDPAYQANVPVAERPRFEAAVAARIAQQLQGRIGFVRFTTQSGGDPLLLFELDRQDRNGTASLREVGFHIALSQRGQPLGEGVYVKFRSQTENFHVVLAPPALLEAVGPKVSEASGSGGPITTLLSKVPIATKAVFMRNPLGWAIPYRRADLCMAPRTMIRVPTTVDSPAASVEHEFTARVKGTLNDGEPRGRMLGVPEPATQANLDDVKNAPPEQVRVEVFYVVEYVPECSAAIAPSQ